MGTKRFDQIIVCDVECTCWEPRELQGDQPSEIIEIGLCRLHMDSLNITDKISILVRPKFSEVTEFCTNLTGLTWDKVKIGMQFTDACNKLFKKFGTSNRTWASWGDCDRNHFYRECREKDARYPFGQSHINISDLFSLFCGETKKFSVNDAMNELGLTFVGKEHCGADDAFNSAMVLRHLIEKTRRNVT